jgi:hypothetical protein
MSIDQEIFVASGIDDAMLCHPVKFEDFESITNAVDGTPKRDQWVPIRMNLFHENEGRPLRETDSPWLAGDALIFNRRAANAMGDLLLDNRELLPLSCKEMELYLFNPKLILDAVDLGRSTLTRFPSSGRIMKIDTYEFFADAIANADAFKTSDLRSGPAFLSGRFVTKWQASGLTGLEFKKIWTSIEGSVGSLSFQRV